MDLINLIGILLFLLFSLIGIVYSLKQRKRLVELTNFQINKETSLGFFIMGLVGAVVMFLIFILNIKLGFIQIELTNDLVSSIKQIPNDFISAFGQEVFFRIFVLIAIIYVTGNRLIALGVSSIIFCLVHPPMDLITVTSYFIAGLMYGLAFIKFKSIWAATGLHFSWNYFQGAIFGFPVSNEFSNGYFDLNIQDNWIWNGGDIGPEGSVFGVICRILIVLIIFLLANKFGVKKSSEFLNIQKNEW